MDRVCQKLSLLPLQVKLLQLLPPTILKTRVDHSETLRLGFSLRLSYLLQLSVEGRGRDGQNVTKNL